MEESGKTRTGPNLTSAEVFRISLKSSGQDGDQDAEAS
jgi:hypothetical protein